MKATPKNSLVYARALYDLLAKFLDHLLTHLHSIILRSNCERSKP